MQLKKYVAITLSLFFISNVLIVNGTAEKAITTFSHGRTLYVDDNADPSWYNETNFKRIQEALDNADSNDTVFVYHGTYYENNVIVDKKINLIGENKNSTLIDVQGSYKGVRIYADEVFFSGFTLRNNTYAFDYWYNSLLEINKSSHVVIKDNIFINNHRTEKPKNICGICILQSKNCLLRSNQFSDCNILMYYLDYLDGFKSNLSYYLHDIDTSNTANGKPILYIKNRDHVDVPSDAGQVILVNCSYCRIANQVITNVTNTIELFYSDHNIIENNYIKGCLQGFWTEYANYNTFRNNVFQNTSCSMWLSFSDYNLFTKNIFVMITIEQKSKFNIFTSNQFYPNAGEKGFSIQLDDSDYNVFSKNNIYSRGLVTIKVWGKCRNTVWNNNYWDKWIGLNHKLLEIFPKIIIGWQRSLYDSFLHIPKKINFPSYLLADLNPAKEPHTM